MDDSDVLRQKVIQALTECTDANTLDFIYRFIIYSL